MRTSPASTQLGRTGERSVQDYIDEVPCWADGTVLTSLPLTAMQWRIWGLAAAGKFFEGLIVFLTGVAIPLIGADFKLDAFQHGIVGGASLSGILLGALTLGGLADTLGRRTMFIIEMVIFILFLVLAALSPSFIWLVVCLFGLGLALGCDYPTAHLIISESVPSPARGRLVLGAFGFQAVGAVTGTLIGFLILTYYPEIDAWRLMYASVVVPALLVVIGRFFVTESAPWLFVRGRIDEAVNVTKRLLKRSPAYPTEVNLTCPVGRDDKKSEPGYGALFEPNNRRATVLAAVPWFFQDLATYGIGIFTPTILASTFGHISGHTRNVSDLIMRDILAAKGAALIDALLIVGIICAVVLTDKVGRIRLQIVGFIGCAVGLLLATISLDVAGTAGIVLLFAGFMLFNFMTNIGPNAQTYLLAGEVFPTKIRGRGAGSAAAFAKIGAVLTAVLFPILMADIGTKALLFGLVATSLIGAAITYRFRIETTGVNLEKIGL